VLPNFDNATTHGFSLETYAQLCNGSSKLLYIQSAPRR
jgi:hypothetical protein